MEIVTFLSHKKPKDPNYYCFSNWCPSRFVVDNITFWSAEHYIMYRKAFLFGDYDVADEILSLVPTAIPTQEIGDNWEYWDNLMNKIKTLGRSIKNFKQDVWDDRQFGLVYPGIAEKFKQNPYMEEILMSTGDKLLVEAAPYDTVWGVGLSADNPDIQDPSKWKGKNLLGKLLMTVRNDIMIFRECNKSTDI
jgi:hypothetical protein